MKCSWSKSISFSVKKLVQFLRRSGTYFAAEYLIDTHAKRVRDAEGKLQRGGILACFYGDDGLPGGAGLLGKLLLCHFTREKPIKIGADDKGLTFAN